MTCFFTKVWAGCYVEFSGIHHYCNSQGYDRVAVCGDPKDVMGDWGVGCVHPIMWDINPGMCWFSYAWPVRTTAICTENGGTENQKASAVPQTNNSCTTKGSVIHTDTQVLSEIVSLTGIDFPIVYSSDKVSGYRAWYEVHIPISDSNFFPDSSTLGKNLQLKVAGQTINLSFPVVPDQSYKFIWNGNDQSGNPFSGSQMASISVVDEFNFPVMRMGDSAEIEIRLIDSTSKSDFINLGKRGPKLNYLNLKSMERYSNEILSKVYLGSVFPSASSIGGWHFSIHHHYDPVRKRLFLGNGESLDVKSFTKSSGNHWVVSADRSEVYVFDSNYRHIQTKYGVSGSTKYTFNYNSSYKLTSIVDAFGNTTSIQYSGANPISITSPFDHITLLGTDANGYLNSISNPASETYQISYTSDGLLQTFENPKGVLSTMQYDPTGRLVNNTSSSGSETSLSRAYDKSSQIITSTTAMGRYTSHKIESGIGAYNRESIFPSKTSAFTVIPNGTNGSTHNRIGAFTKYEVKKEDTRFGNSVTMPSFLSIYDGGQTHSVYFDEQPVLADPHDPFSLVTLLKTATFDGKITSSLYTSSSKTTVTNSPLGRETTTVYNSNDQILSQKFSTLIPISYSYDSAGRIQKIEQSSSRAYIFNYDTSTGFLTSIVNPLNQVVTFGHDLAGRIISQTLPDLRVISYSYDLNGNLTGLTPPGRPVHLINFNDFDLPSSYIPPTISAPNATQSTYYYNDDQQLIQVTRPDGQDIDFNFDEITGNLSSIDLTIGVRLFGHNIEGHMNASISEDFVNRNMSYSGNLIYFDSISGPLSYTNSNWYNSNMQLAQEHLNLADPVAYYYDNDNLLIAAGSEIITREAETGFITNVSLGNITENYNYSSDYGELINMTANFNNTTKYAETMTRDALGRIVTRTEKYESGAIKTYVFTYDPAGRLTHMTLDGVLRSQYSYDSNSNRISQTIAGVTKNATYDDQDRLLNFGNKSFSYNLNGEVATMEEGTTTTTLTYDVFGNLKNFSKPDLVITYQVDAHNRRISKKVGEEVQSYFVWNTSNQLVGIADGSGVLLSHFIYGTKAHVPDYMIKSGETFKIVTNHLGSPVMILSEATGASVQSITYDEFGAITSDSAPGFTPFGFAGCLYDVDTKLCRFGARDYDASIGRWLSKDPILFAGGDTNLYGYVLQDPINLIDPSGLCPWCLGAVLGGGYALITGGSVTEIIAGAVLGGLTSGWSVGGQMFFDYITNPSPIDPGSSRPGAPGNNPGSAPSSIPSFPNPGPGSSGGANSCSPSYNGPQISSNGSF